MNWYELCVTAGRHLSEEMTAVFVMHGIEDLLIEGENILADLEDSGIHWDYLEEDLKPSEDGEVLYKGHIECEETDLKELKRSIMQTLNQMGIAFRSFTVVEIDPLAGIDNWKQYFKPFSVCEGIVVCPSWETYEAQEGESLLLMDPGSAFGTGTHETTSLCAKFLSKYVEGGESVLDLGCGSGILSIIALFKGADRARAVDIDPLALSASRENAEKNGLSDRIDIAGAEDDYGKDYEIIVSNLTSPILMELSKRIGEASKAGTLFICSGILSVSKAPLIEEYERLGFHLIEEAEEGEWSGLVFRR